MQSPTNFFVRQRAERLRNVSLPKFAWASLKRYQNVDLVAGLICDRFGLPKNQKVNAKRQATQIRYCLIQAQEYLEAAAAVSPATSPLLTYYGAMSLALAELLWKQDGNSRLSQLRQHHDHHGLTLHSGITRPGGSDLESSCSELKAKPYGGAKGRKGTFEVWHRSATRSPLIGTSTQHLRDNERVLEDRTVYHRFSDELEQLPDSGMTLFDCLRYLPATQKLMYGLGASSRLVRAQIHCDIDAFDEQRKQLITIGVHPDPDQRKIVDVQNKILLPASHFEETAAVQFQSGFQVTFTMRRSDERNVLLPDGFSSAPQLVFLSPDSMALNEFGLYYVGLYIAGMFSRYFPDVWVAELDMRTPLSIAVEELVSTAQDRLPLLCLGEFSEKYYIAGQ